ncbi:MAG TPA: hypothetical protein VMB81_20375 [Candidatus Sulfotelmatobacter sp.]|nr:hypothetical protein [Candidatus Sulfotelmatobacter sp.]
MNRYRLPLLLLVCILLASAPAQRALAWGATGHRLIARLAVENLPDEIPGFLRTPDVAWRIGELGREADRVKGAGRTFDSEHSPAHYVNVGDDYLIAGGPRLMALPETREAYDSALRALGTTEYVYGYLPYAIVDGWQRLRKDFGYWRADMVGERAGASAEDRAWFARDRQLRELVIVRDLGYWAHFVGDGSQPMHVSVHANGWGPFANPHGYSQAPLHAPFEGEFVRAHVGAADIMAHLVGRWDCNCPVERRTALYLAATLRTVEPFYALEQKGGLTTDPAAGAAFAAERLAAAVAELRDMTVDAWRASIDAKVGYPPVAVRDIESGAVSPPIGPLQGLD